MAMVDRLQRLQPEAAGTKLTSRGKGSPMAHLVVLGLDNREEELVQALQS